MTARKRAISKTNAKVKMMKKERAARYGPAAKCGNIEIMKKEIAAV